MNHPPAPLLTDFLTQWLIEHGLDGLYLVGYEGPDRLKVGSVPAEQTLGLDGDGVANSAETIAGSYSAGLRFRGLAPC